MLEPKKKRLLDLQNKQDFTVTYCRINHIACFRCSCPLIPLANAYRGKLLHIWALTQVYSALNNATNTHKHTHTHAAKILHTLSVYKNLKGLLIANKFVFHLYASTLWEFPLHVYLQNIPVTLCNIVDEWYSHLSSRFTILSAVIF